MNRRKFIGYLGAASLAGQAGLARAQDGPLRIVVPYVAGGVIDFMARLVAGGIGPVLGRQVIVDNRPGASSLIGTRLVMEAPSDGETLLFQHGGFVATPMLQKNAGFYDPIRDFEPLSALANSIVFLMVHESVPAKTIGEFISYARTLPDGIDAANAGIQSAQHIITMRVERGAGIKMNHVPYKGNAEMANALIKGEVKVQITSLTSSLMGQIKTGKVRILATLSSKRTSLMPDMPTFAESVPGVSIDDNWFGLFAPQRTPTLKMAKLSEALRTVMADPSLRARFLEAFIEPMYTPPSEFRVMVESAVQEWRRTIAALNLQPE